MTFESHCDVEMFDEEAFTALSLAELATLARSPVLNQERCYSAMTARQFALRSHSRRSRPDSETGSSAIGHRSQTWARLSVGISSLC
jgi:hypothetical protein